MSGAAIDVIRITFSLNAAITKGHVGDGVMRCEVGRDFLEYT